MFPPDLSVGIDETSVRILDIGVLSKVTAGSNMTTLISDNDAIARFELSWLHTINSTSASKDEISAAWGVFNSEFFHSFAVEPVYYGACDAEACVGVTVVDKKCVCS